VIYNAKATGAAIASEAFSVVNRFGADIAAQVADWSDTLLREPRVCVPIDVQALAVADDDPADAGVPLTGPLSPGCDAGADAAIADRQASLTGPEAFADPTPRDPGAHLHWALPDALLTGHVTEGSADLGLPALPDRWLVVRLLVPADGTLAHTRGWIVDALTGAAWDLGQTGGDAPARTRAVDASELDGTAGGTLTWTAGYDAARGRFTFHDPQDDIAADPTLGGALPGGIAGGRATYLVVGWWTTPALDPLDRVHGTNALSRRLEELGWALERGSAATAAGTAEAASTPPSPVRQTAERFAGTVRDRVDTVSLAAGVLGGRGLTEATYIEPVRPVRPPASTLLHGCVTGVPVRVEGMAGRIRGGDLRPDPSAVGVALGDDLYDAIAALTARVLAADGTDAQREATEDLVAAFVQSALPDLQTADGAAEIDEGVHAGGFTRVASTRPGIVDRLVDGGVAVPGPGRRIGSTGPDRVKTTLPDRAVLAFATGASPLLFAKGTAMDAAAAASARASTPTAAGSAGSAGSVGKYAAFAHFDRARLFAGAASSVASAAGRAAASGGTSRPRPAATSNAQVREVTRPDPGYAFPSDPYVLVRGGGRSSRFGGDGLWRPDGRLDVRHPSQLCPDLPGVLPGAAVVATLPSGAIPPEATALAREALLFSPHAASWLADRAAARSKQAGSGLSRAVIAGRITGELLLRYGASGAYLTTEAVLAEQAPAPTPPSLVSHAVSAPPFSRARLFDAATVEAADALRLRSLLPLPPSPVGVTAWAQPWSPVWLEYRVEVCSGPVADGTGAPGAVTTPGAAPAWALGLVDLEPAAEPPADVVRTVTSRVPLTTGVARAFGGAIDTYLKAEAERDVTAADDPLQGRLSTLAGFADTADLAGASLDGIHRRLLGLAERTLVDADSGGTRVPETPVDDPLLLTAGRLRVVGLRLLDTFGRVLALDPAQAMVPSRLALGEGELLRRPRFTAPTRVALRFVDAAAQAPAGAVDARVDEQEPAKQVSPVCGFLLPDHVDESIEVFGPDATPLGELLVTGAVGTTGGGVVWEPAPGRPVPPDAAPNVGLLDDEAQLGAFATGIVRADASARDGERGAGGVGGQEPGEGPTESALNALLRCIDQTLWMVDPTAAVGSAQLASIVGLPIAVVRAVLQVDVSDDLGDLTMDAATAAARTAAYDALTQAGVRVRLGELTRSDDGLLAWFADDDYTRVHLVDRTIAEEALPSGPGRGVLSGWGVDVTALPPEPVRHPYISDDAEIVVRPGVPRMLTLLMTPGAAVFHTSGIVPRGRVQLQRAWFTPAVDRLVPSVRVGPVLVDPGDVRLPLVAALGEHQSLTVREGPTAWRNDAILAATQSALLPDRATVLREGWIRVTPGEDDDRR